MLEAYVEEEVLRFAAYAYEKCPKSGKDHLQAYCCFPHPVSWERVVRLFPHSYVDGMKGKLVDSESYCSKAGTLVKIGDEPVNQGQRSDIIRARDRVEDGERPMKIARTSKDDKMVNTIVRHYRFFDAQYQEVRWEQRCREGHKPVELYIYTGTQGVGKTPKVWNGVTYDTAATDLWKAWHTGGEYYNGYRGQRYVFFEDVERGEKLPKWSTFKEIFDGQPMQVNAKFGEPIVFDPERVYITSNHHWRHWYDYRNEIIDFAAMEKRITLWIEYINGEEIVRIDKRNHATHTQESSIIEGSSLSCEEAENSYEGVLFSQGSG